MRPLRKPRTIYCPPDNGYSTEELVRHLRPLKDKRKKGKKLRRVGLRIVRSVDANKRVFLHRSVKEAADFRNFPPSTLALRLGKLRVTVLYGIFFERLEITPKSS